jgi:hypothetical protein
MASARSETPPVEESVAGLWPHWPQLCQDRRAAFLVVISLLVVIALPLLFSLTTRQVWEDFLITFRYSCNAARGVGLVYNPGERVYGFTSPLNVLLPLLWQIAFKTADYHPALWFFSACGLVVMCLGIIAVVWQSYHHGARTRYWLIVLIPVICLLQVKTTAFAINGQEAGFLVGFLALALVGAVRGFSIRPSLSGLAWAGLFWTRPDAPVYIAALVLSGLLFNGRPCRVELRGVAKSALICTALYLPWVAWTTWYYGSPIPHTAIAKVGVLAEQWGGVGGWRQFPRSFVTALSRAFEPIYAEAGGWPRWLAWFSLGCGLFSAIYWVLPTPDRLGRTASIGFLFIGVYLGWMGTTGIVYPWYFPPMGLLASIVLGRSLGLLAATAPVGVTALACAAIMGPAAWLFSASLFEVRLQQHEIETGTRAMVGEWLRAHAQPGESVFLEPIGYIGYYSHMRVIDYPGLVSPLVVSLRHSGVKGFFALARIVKPQWLVVRTREVTRVRGYPEFQQDYALVMSFDAIPRLERSVLPEGYGYLLMDSRYLILRRRDLPRLPAGDTATSLPGTD